MELQGQRTRQTQRANIAGTELQDSYHSVTLQPLQCPRALPSSMLCPFPVPYKERYMSHSSHALHTGSIHTLPNQQMTRRFLCSLAIKTDQ